MTNYIEVRSYGSKTINLRSDSRPIATDYTCGVWRVRYINRVPEHITRLASMI